MFVSSTAYGSTQKTVTIQEAGPEQTDDAVLDLALLSCRETRSSLCSWKVIRASDGYTATVVLYTD